MFLPLCTSAPRANRLTLTKPKRNHFSKCGCSKNTGDLCAHDQETNYTSAVVFESMARAFGSRFWQLPSRAELANWLLNSQDMSVACTVVQQLMRTVCPRGRATPTRHTTPHTHRATSASKTSKMSWTWYCESVCVLYKPINSETY